MKAKKVNKKIDELRSLLEELYRNPSRDLEDRVYEKYEEVMFEIYNDASLLEKTKAYVKSYEEGWIDATHMIDDYYISDIYSSAISKTLSDLRVDSPPNPTDYVDEPKKYVSEYRKFVRAVTKSFLFHELPSYMDKLIMNIANERNDLNESRLFSLEKAKKLLGYYEIDPSVNIEKLFPNRYAYRKSTTVYDGKSAPYLGMGLLSTVVAAGIEYGLYKLYKYLGDDYDLIRYGLIVFGVVVALYYIVAVGIVFDSYNLNKSFNEGYKKIWKDYL